MNTQDKLNKNHDTRFFNGYADIFFQLRIIDEAKEQGIDVSTVGLRYKNGCFVFNSHQMHELITALKMGLDISVMAKLNADEKPVFTKSQMLQIRKALKRNIDISELARIENDKSVNSVNQMKAILEKLI